MSSIEKVAVYDPRIVQEPPAYAVKKGALSSSVAPFQAVSATTNQHTYQVLVPSLNVFVDRKVLWQTGVNMQATCVWSGPCLYTPGPPATMTIQGATTAISGSGQPQVYTTVPTLTDGQNFITPILGVGHSSLCAFPLQSLCTNMTASINDAVVTTNGDTIKEQILLTQTRANIRQRTTPSRFDKYASNLVDSTTMNGNLGFGYSGSSYSDTPNSAWPLTYYNAQGAALAGQGYYVDGNNNHVSYYKGIPHWVAGMDATKQYIVYFSYTVTEPLLISPFLWADSMDEDATGLYGVTNMQITMNLQTPSSAVATAIAAGSWVQSGNAWVTGTFNNSGAFILRTSTAYTCLNGLALTSTSSTQPFTNPRLILNFLTPGPDVSLPLVSSVPYMEFPRYITQVSFPSVPPPSSLVVQSQTVTLSSIPDSLVVFIKPNFRQQADGDIYLPITNVSVTFDNFSNLLSGFSQQTLYSNTVAAGVDLDWLTWSGAAVDVAKPLSLDPQVNINGTPAYPILGYGLNDEAFWDLGTAMCGAPLVLRMGTDVTLSPGLAPGCLGNYSVQITATVNTGNLYGSPILNGSTAAWTGCTMYIMAVTSGFFETVRGQSAVRKTILNAADVAAAHSESAITSTHIARMVGSGNSHSHGGCSMMGAHRAFMAKMGGSGSAGSGSAGSGIKRARM